MTLKYRLTGKPGNLNELFSIARKKGHSTLQISSTSVFDGLLTKFYLEAGLSKLKIYESQLSSMINESSEIVDYMSKVAREVNNNGLSLKVESNTKYKSLIETSF